MAKRVLARRRREALQAELKRRDPLGPEFRAKVEAALAGAPERADAPRSAAGDPLRLRGIPVVGGAAGAIPGTVPGRGRIERWTPR